MYHRAYLPANTRFPDCEGEHIFTQESPLNALRQYNGPMDFELRNLIEWGTPLLLTVLTVGIAYWLLGKTFANQPQNRLYRQLSYVGLTIVALVILVLVLPFSVETRGQLLSLFGIVLTTVIALSSTTFVSNAMAGLMLKATGGFHTGDFIRVQDQFGRVTSKTLLHTEIQSEDRDLVTLPNLYLITNPVKVVDQTGTLVSAELALGYEVNRHTVTPLLIEAATKAELTDPFVHVMEIGDHALTYRVTGFLEDVGKIVSKRSELRGHVLDTLHDHAIEVMTPSIMNQRPLHPESTVIPEPTHVFNHEPSGDAEKIMFDKAELAARIERFRQQCEKLEAEIDSLREDKSDNKMEISWREHQLEALKDIITRLDVTDD